MSKCSPVSLTIWYEPPMKPEGVVSGVPEVYSNVSPGRSVGVPPSTERVGDLPMTAEQLHRDIALVLDADLVLPDELEFGRIGLIRQILRPDGH